MRTHTPRKAVANVALYSNSVTIPGLFLTPVRHYLSLPLSVTILGLASPCALSRFIADRGNHCRFASGSTVWYLSRFPSTPPMASSLADPFFQPLPPLNFSHVDSFSVPPHSFIPMFVLLFALSRFSYVCVYLCRLPVFSYYYTSLPCYHTDSRNSATFGSGIAPTNLETGSPPLKAMTVGSARTWMVKLR